MPRKGTPMRNRECARGSRRRDPYGRSCDKARARHRSRRRGFDRPHDPAPCGAVVPGRDRNSIAGIGPSPFRSYLDPLPDRSSDVPCDSAVPCLLRSPDTPFADMLTGVVRAIRPPRSPRPRSLGGRCQKASPVHRWLLSQARRKAARDSARLWSMPPSGVSKKFRREFGIRGTHDFDRLVGAKLCWHANLA